MQHLARANARVELSTLGEGVVPTIYATIMKKIIYSLPIALVALATLGSCAKEHIDTPKAPQAQGAGAELVSTGLRSQEGIVRVRFDRALGDKLAEAAAGLRQLSEHHAELDQLLRQIGAKSFERVFPPCPKFEARQRRAGLHLWYDIEFDESHALRSVSTQVRHIPGVSIVEEIPVYSNYAGSYTLANVPTSSEGREVGDMPYDDPELPKQWHYYNTGEQALKSVAGADINLFAAWEITTGRRQVIVGVTDGGVDIKHEDLVDNLWINTKEQTGLEGVDDDENGYVDDVYGYNFVSGNAVMTPEEHGTHVAGIVGARTNNGKGIAGVAGGDGSSESGVRLLPTQVFQGSRSGGHERAIAYQANNGAVISQNSWGGNPGASMSPSMREAINYFIQYAGCDSEGKQLPDSPMKGGVVIFAAGNENTETLVYPAAYAPVIAVGAMAPNWERADYSNFGDWVDITAPGGDLRFANGRIYSTLPGNTYGYKSGTSQACPHVSGIAGLIVSKYGGEGFTSEQCKALLLNSLRPQDANVHNPNYIGKMGVGYIDARRAFDTNRQIAPNKVAQVQTTVDYDGIKLSWAAVADGDDGSASHYILYYRKGNAGETMDASNYQSESIKLVYNAMQYKAQDQIERTLSNLELSTTYLFALVAQDRWGLMSEPAFFSATTKANHAPVIEKLSGPDNIRITGTETATLVFRVTDKDNHTLSYSLRGQTRGVSMQRSEDQVMITIEAKAVFGTYTTELAVADVFGAVTTYPMSYEVYENHAPRQQTPFAKLFMPTGGTQTLDLSKYFVDEDGHAMSYRILSLNSALCTATIEGSTLSIQAKEQGSGTIELVVSDSQKAERRASLQLQVVKDAIVYQVYPIPARDVLNLRLSNEVADATIELRAVPSGALVLSRQITALTGADKHIALDVSKLSGGSYMLHVKALGKEYKQAFIKY